MNANGGSGGGGGGGTILPGTKIKVGQFHVTVVSFLSQGGFAHVYKATSSTPIPLGSPYATTTHVLKRIAVPDKAGVEQVGKEVEVMKALRNHPKIVNFIEASFSEIPASEGNSKSYEIFILMEWCSGGGIIDMMNTRLQNRMGEQEILKIFSDTVEAVAYMHYQSPPLIHRDLKVENILLSSAPSISAPGYPTYKLCDFGSTTTPLTRIPTAVNEIQALEADINSTTTLQYRAPELMDVWSRKGFNEKIDIWALGVLLYKLCYYTTPFEESGPLGILNAQYKIPSHPVYSNEINALIGTMLQESAAKRPNIYQLHVGVCRLRGTVVRLLDKYAVQPTLATQPLPPLPSSSSSSRAAKVSLNHTPSTEKDSTYASLISIQTSAPSFSTDELNESIAPMRRGRPSKAAVVPSAATSSTANGFGDAFTPSSIPSSSYPNPARSSTLPTTTAPAHHSPSMSFGDSFAPPPALPLKSSRTAMNGSISIANSSASSSSSHLFADLVPVSSSPSGSRRHTPVPLAFPSLTGSGSNLSSSASIPPPTSDKVVSRSAQTSPSLHASLIASLTPAFSSLPAATVSNPPPISFGTKPVSHSRDQSPMRASPASAPSTTTTNTSQLNLMSNTGTGKFRPVKNSDVNGTVVATSRGMTTPVKNSFSTVGHVVSPIIRREEMVKEQEASERFPALEDEDDIRLYATNKEVKEIVRGEQKQLVKEEEEWLPIVEKELESSDDNEDESPPPASVLSPSAVSIVHPIPSSASSSKARALVDKFETISSPSTSSSPPAAVVRSKPSPPPPATKPTALRRSSSISSSSPSTSTSNSAPILLPPTSSFPIHKRLSLAPTDRRPFKPVAPPLSSSPVASSSSSTRGFSIAGAGGMKLEDRIAADRARLSLVKPDKVKLERGEEKEEGEEEEEEEERPFAGVSSMVNRWNQGGSGNGQAKVDVKGSRVRKEWAVV